MENAVPQHALLFDGRRVLNSGSYSRTQVLVVGCLFSTKPYSLQWDLQRFCIPIVGVFGLLLFLNHRLGKNHRRPMSGTPGYGHLALLFSNCAGNHQTL